MAELRFALCRTHTSLEGPIILDEGIQLYRLLERIIQMKQIQLPVKIL